MTKIYCEIEQPNDFIFGLVFTLLHRQILISLQRNLQQMGEENKEEKEEETKEKEMSVMDKLKKLRESIVVFPIIGKCIGELPVLFLSISAAIFAISILGFVLRLLFFFFVLLYKFTLSDCCF